MENLNYEFGGWATKNDLLCADGRTIRRDAFKDCDGKTVPLVWNHQHNDPTNVIGHAVLENRSDGVYAYCTFNDTEKGQHMRTAVNNGDLRSLSIYANKLKQKGMDVVHGVIRELSVVLAGANPGAFIDFVVAHEEDGEDGFVASYDEPQITILMHSAENKSEHKEDEKVADETKTTETEEKELTVEDVYNRFDEDEKKVVHYLIAKALEDAGVSDDGEEEINHSEGGNETMKQNVFDQDEVIEGGTLTHADGMAIVELAKQSSVGSLKAAMKAFIEENESLAHALDLGDAEVLEELLPDHKLLNPGAPERLGPDQGWVMGVINKIKKSPYSRVRTRKADARVADLRAKGFKKGSEKEVGNKIKLIGRKTEPTTIYVKEELNRDDIIDITDFDVINHTWGEMKASLYETLALAALVSDGREDGDPDKISETNIRPIWKDEELYTIHKIVDIAKMKAELQGSDTAKHFGDNYVYAEAIITDMLYARENYKGSGSPDLFCAPHLVNVMLLARDMNGRRIYDSKADLARALNVNSIVEVEQLEGLTRTNKEGKEVKLLGLVVNLSDYQFGSTKGGEVTKFDDFDIDFNKYKYLMETRLSGALVEPYSAIALEELVAEGE